MAHRYWSCVEIMMGEYTGKIAVSKDTMLFILNEVLENDIKKSTTKENILKMVPEIYEKTEASELIKIFPYETYLLLEGLIEYVKKSDDILGFDSKCRELRKVEELKHLYDMMILVLNQKGAETTWHVNGNVLEKLERLFSVDNRKIAARYWRMERLTMGMLYSYGVVDFDFLRKQLSRYIGEIISEAELDADGRRELYTRLENTPDCNNLCHGDFNPSNIIVSECGIPYILDWSRAARGSVAVDAAVTYLLFRLDGDMDGAEQYLEMFCKKSDTEREDLLSLTNLAAAALSTEKHGKAREFLLSHAMNADF